MKFARLSTIAMRTTKDVWYNRFGYILDPSFADLKCWQYIFLQKEA